MHFLQTRTIIQTDIIGVNYGKKSNINISNWNILKIFSKIFNYNLNKIWFLFKQKKDFLAAFNVIDIWISYLKTE